MSKDTPFRSFWLGATFNLSTSKGLPFCSTEKQAAFTNSQLTKHQTRQLLRKQTRFVNVMSPIMHNFQRTHPFASQPIKKAFSPMNVVGLLFAAYDTSPLHLCAALLRSCSFTKCNFLLGIFFICDHISLCICEHRIPNEFSHNNMLSAQVGLDVSFVLYIIADSPVHL
jgi:hypothetical protein